MTYLRYLLTTTLLILIACVSINFFVDPASVYHSDQAPSSVYADELIKSEFGLWWPENSFEDRAIKKPLSKYASASECVVVGSSHIMQLGSARISKTLTDQCASILNLGVSGASIEDQFVLVYLSLQNGHPKKIILGVDPWTFAFGKDARWSYYADDYKQAKRDIFGKSHVNDENANGIQLSKLRNLINLEYTVRSMRKFASNIMYGPIQHAAKQAPIVDEFKGGKYPILFKDGSLLYSEKYITSAKKKPIPFGGVTYATSGVLNDPSAIKAYKSMLLWIQARGVEPILLMTPYHQNVWKSGDSYNTRALVATEPIVRKLGSELGLKVIGTYDPDIMGCPTTEFYDFMHASTACLAKLQQH
jgi:hypothetical protein